MKLNHLLIFISILGCFLLSILIYIIFPEDFEKNIEILKPFIGLATVVFAALVVYFLPTIVARSNHHHNTMAIFILNLFLGWTFLGWVIALVWAFTRK